LLPDFQSLGGNPLNIISQKKNSKLILNVLH
jgi:hypothetical protein